jgi:hypothetical protein
MEDFPARFSTGWVEFYERRNTEAGLGREAAGEAAAATEMDSPDCLRLPEIGLRMIVDLLPHLGDGPIQAGCAWEF